MKETKKETKTDVVIYHIRFAIDFDSIEQCDIDADIFDVLRSFGEIKIDEREFISADFTKPVLGD